MKRWGWNIFFTCLILLSFFLCWVWAAAIPPNPQQQGESIVEGNPDTLAGTPTALILLGVGLVNVAIWGRKKCRRGSPGTDRPG
jgi:predicted MFS family arabinose efflux permease